MSAFYIGVSCMFTWLISAQVDEDEAAVEVDAAVQVQYFLEPRVI